jgi:hypothetical protein
MTLRRLATALGGACALALAAASCGGHSPNAPTPGGGNGGSNQQPPPNNLPVIDAITIQGARPRQPANFADAGETVDVTAKVHDDETAADQLQYEWTASTGTFSGTGTSVRWTAPAQLPGSASGDVTLTLKVIEKYGQPGSAPTFEHDVSGTASLSLHDSIKEIGDMARQFLLEFSDSSQRDAAAIVRNFTDATKDCADGKQREQEEVAQNRIDYHINQSTIGAATVTIKFGTLCPFRLKGADACAQIPADWSSTRLTPGGTTPVGGTEHVAGTDQVTAIYVSTQKKWGLCESDFDGHLAARSTFIR